ncbi:MAG: FAD-dependent oxidoreductase [Vicinamibacterales bacterium]
MTQESGQTVDVLVVGAGVAGLTVAAELQRAGCRVLVLDKGRGVGGRLASRRIGGAAFDHGAQFITARTSRFAALIEDGRRAGAVEEWHRGLGDSSNDHVRWRGHPAMTSIAKYLARGIQIVLDTRVVALRASRHDWSAETETGAVYSADAVVLTPPVPQSLALLKAGTVALQPETRARLEGLEYERCLAVMAVLAGPSRLAPPGGLAPDDGPIAWIADNQLKGISAEPAVTIHASHAFSLEHWERDRQESGRRLLDAADSWLGADVRTFQVHGWLFSKPLQVDEHRCAMVAQSPPLVLAGDAFAGSRVEGAALSGWAAAEAVLGSAL